MINIVYQDDQVIVCVKPAGVRSTDEPGGLPELVRQTLGNEKADVRTVHRLDQVVSGLMVLARTTAAASELSRQVRENEFHKAYLAVVRGCPAELRGTMTDLLLRNKPERKTYVVHHLEKGVQEAVLDYEVLQPGEMSLVYITLRTGRTHQIRAQFSSRGLPLVGDRKYGGPEEEGPIALWSHLVGFVHPKTGKAMEFRLKPPDSFPWNTLIKEDA